MLIYVIWAGYKTAANYKPGSERNRNFAIWYIFQPFLFFMSEPFQGVIALRVGFLLADFRQGYKHPSCYIPSLFVFTLYFSPFPRNSYYIPLLFYDVGQHLKKQNLIFRTIYTFSHYLNVFNIFSVILRLVMKSWA